MSRPGFVLGVDDRTPPLMTLAGAQLRMERFGVGTTVVYPADAVASSNPVGLIESALAAPIDAEPLMDQLTKATTLTIVVIDCDRPLPRPQFDVRRTLVERVLEAAARKGVDDVEIVIANGLRRRWSDAHVTEVLGDRVASSFLPDGLVVSHDATSDDLVTLGEVEGLPVRFNRRVAESDLVVTVGVRADFSTNCPFIGGLTDVDTINALHGATATPERRSQVRALVGEKVNCFALIGVLGQPLMAPNLRFTSKREWEWGLGDRLAFATARQIVAALPRQGAQALHGNPRADYPVVDIVGGSLRKAFDEARAVWQAANAVEVKSQADVFVTSVWGASVDEGDAFGSPLDAARYALVSSAGSHTGKPFMREGGVVIAFHPLRHRFSNRRQSAAADFFAKVLPETTDPEEIAATYEPRAIQDAWYLDLYRKQFADHPLLTFHRWYETARAAADLSDVIWVGANRRSAALMGHRAATTYADALEIASNHVGRAPAITYLHGPGLALGDVR